MARPSGLNYKGRFHVIEVRGELLLVCFKTERPQNSDIVSGNYHVIEYGRSRSALYRERRKLESEFYKWKSIFGFLNNSRCSTRAEHSSWFLKKG